MFLSSQMILSFVSAAMVWAILERISGMDPSSVTMDPKYLKLWTVTSFSPLTPYVTADAIGVVGHQLSLLSTDLPAVCGKSLVKALQ